MAAAEAAAKSGVGKVTKLADPVDPSEYYNTRVAMIEKRRANGENPFPHKYHVSISLTEFCDKFQKTLTEKDTILDDQIVSVAGNFFGKLFSYLMNVFRTCIFKTGGRIEINFLRFAWRMHAITNFGECKVRFRNCINS